MSERNAIDKALSLFSAAQAAKLQVYLDKMGSRVEGLYAYCTPDGAPYFGQLRLREGASKTFRAFHFDGDQLVFKKPAKPEGGYPLFGGQLPAKFPRATVIVCEGEKATLAVINHAREARMLQQWVAVTSGSAQSAAMADWDALAGRRVIVWADNDAAGIKYAHDVRDNLRGIANGCKFIDIAQLNLPHAGDAADWVDSQIELPGESLAELPVTAEPPAVTAANADTHTRPHDAPLPLHREGDGRSAFPIHALGSLLGPAAQAIAQSVQCPPAIAGNAVLACAALGVQGLANVLVDGRETPTSLFLLSIAVSGERKTAVDSLATSAVYRKQKADQVRHKGELKAYRAALKCLPKGAIEPDQPIDPTMLVQDVTTDALIRGLINGYPSQGLFLSEGGSFLGGYAMSKDMKIRTSATLSSIWSGESISQSRVTGRHSANGRRLSIHLQVQPEIVADFVGDEQLQAQGLLQRFLMSLPDSHIGTRTYSSHNIKQDPVYVAFTTQLDRLLETGLPIDASGDLAPRAVVPSDSAHSLWIDAYNAIEHASAPGEALENYQAYASKLAEQVLRIAGVITIFENPDATEISKDTMHGAIELAQYYLREAMSLLLGPADKLLARARELLEWLRRYPSPIALRDVYRLGPQFVRSAAQARELLEILIDHGWVARHEGRITSIGGKTSHENYAVVANV